MLQSARRRLAPRGTRAIALVAAVGCLPVHGACDARDGTERSGHAPALVTPAARVCATEFEPPAAAPLPASEGTPIVAIDHGHHNLHRMDGTYRPFAALLSKLGMQVRAHEGPFEAEALRGVDVLVISNARSRAIVDDPDAVVGSSAFSETEIAVLRAFIEAGGGLLLIADHAPFPSSAADLASALGLELDNGYVRDAGGDSTLRFEPRAGGLARHFVTEGIARVVTFEGHAFVARPGEPWTALFTLPKGAVSLRPVALRRFDHTAQRVPAGGHLQGALRELGAGRVAVFGEAAMFSAQEMGRLCEPKGWNHPEAGGNASLASRLLVWLSRHDVPVPRRAEGRSSQVHF